MADIIKSPLTDIVQLAHPNNYYGLRTVPVAGMSPHHAGCKAKLENICKSFANPNRGASANYVIGIDGQIALCVPENYASGCSDSFANDNKMITVELINDGGAETGWHISDATIEAYINLAVDIHTRYGLGKVNYTGDKNGNMTLHRMFAATACPGEYFMSKIPYIVEEINKRYSKSGGKNPVPSRVDIYYNSYTAKDKWLESVVNYNTRDYNGYSGIIGRAIQGFACNAQSGNVKYRAHVVGGGWLDWVTDCDYTHYDGYAGILGKDIDGLQLTLLNLPGKHVRYRVHLLGGEWLDWVTDCGTGASGYAGIYGRPIDAVQCEIV